MNTHDARSGALLFDPMRLRIARQAALLKKKDLAERVGVSAAAVSQYEKGQTRPSPKVVAALALALGVPVGFFVGDRDLGEAPATTAHFRSLRSTTQQERDRAFAHALLTWELTRALERRVRLPDVDLSDHLSVRIDDPIQAVEDAAREARRFFQLGTGPIPNVIRLLESKGLVCTRLPARTRRVFAFSCAFPGRPVVVLSSERTHRAAGRFDAAHELGHLLMHHDEEPGSHAVERQAHAFASEFLAPASEVKDLLPRTANWQRLLELKQVWGVSIQALLFRAKGLGIMPEHTYRRAMSEINTRGWRETEPGDDGDAEEPVMLGRALDVLAEQGIDVELIAVEARLAPDVLALIAGRDDRPDVSIGEGTQRHM